MELPTYRVPKLSNVVLTIIEKTKAFVLEAGKIILAISIILWVLASFGPGESFENARDIVIQESQNLRLPPNKGWRIEVAAYKLETLLRWRYWQAIEPAIKPLGYDWKIGIALITSFAAREVFVGTIATIYSIGSVSEDDSSTIKERLKAEVNPETGGPRYTVLSDFPCWCFTLSPCSV